MACWETLGTGIHANDIDMRHPPPAAKYALSDQRHHTGVVSSTWQGIQGIDLISKLLSSQPNPHPTGPKGSTANVSVPGHAGHPQSPLPMSWEVAALWSHESDPYNVKQVVLMLIYFMIYLPAPGQSKVLKHYLVIHLQKDSGCEDIFILITR